MKTNSEATLRKMLAYMEHEFPELRPYVREIRAELNSMVGDYEELLAQAKMIGARNPAFNGDMVGWLPDDFD